MKNEELRMKNGLDGWPTLADFAGIRPETESESSPGRESRVSSIVKFESRRDGRTPTPIDGRQSETVNGLVSGHGLGRAGAWDRTSEGFSPWAKRVINNRQSTIANAFAYLASRLRYGLTLGLSALREIFDESAYARFLHREQLQPSRDSYAAFLRDTACRRQRRPRCC